MVDRTCEHCGTTFPANRRGARFCGDACRSAHGRSERIATGRPRTPRRDAMRSLRVSNPAGTLDKLMAKSGTLPEPPEVPLCWERVNVATHKLTDGGRERAEGPMGFATTRAVAWVIDLGLTERASWVAVCRNRTIGPAWMEAAGLSADRPGLSEARMVAKAMATGDVRPLVLAAHRIDDCTEDMRLALKGMLELLEEPDYSDEPTELPDAETEEIVVALLNDHWRVVEANGFWILQRHLAVEDEWEWAARVNRKQTLIHAVEHLVGEVDTEAWSVVDALPEKPGIPPPPAP